MCGTLIKMDRVITLFAGVVGVVTIILLIQFILPLPGNQVDGEFEEGVIFGVFEKYKLQEPVCCSYYGATEIKLQNHSWLWFHYDIDYVKNLEPGKVYGFYYTSSEVEYATNPGSRWLPYIDKIVDCEDNVMWESHYGELPPVCISIILIIVIVIVVVFLFAGYMDYREAKKNEIQTDTDKRDKTS